MDTRSNPADQAPQQLPANPAKKQNIWFGNIEDADYAKRIIKDVANGLYFLGILQGAIEYLLLGLGLAGIIDGLILIVLGFFISKQSRVAAVILIIYSVFILVTTIAATLNLYPGGHNILLAVILMWVAVRAVQAIFKLHHLKK